MAAGWDEMVGFFCTTHLKAGIRRAIDASVHLQMRSVVDEMRTKASSRDLCGELSRLDNILMDLCTSSHIIFHA